jgi:hypothetical protein
MNTETLDLMPLRRAKNQLADTINWLESSRQRPEWPQPSADELARKLEMALAPLRDLLADLKK